MAHTLILGIGNTLLSDDGAGIHALREMQHRVAGRSDVELIDGGTLSFTLLPAIETAQNLIVLDATQLNAEPGTVQCFQGRELDVLLTRPRRSVHEVSLLDLFGSARLVGTLPERRALIGVQPASLEWGEHPSPAVAAAIPWMVDIALECLASWTERAEEPRFRGREGANVVGGRS